MAPLLNFRWGVIRAFSVALKKHTYSSPLPAVAPWGCPLCSPAQLCSSHWVQPVGNRAEMEGREETDFGIYSPSPLLLCGSGGSFQEVLSCQIDSSQPWALEMLRLLNLGVRHSLWWFSCTSLIPLPYYFPSGPFLMQGVTCLLLLCNFCISKTYKKEKKY